MNKGKIYLLLFLLCLNVYSNSVLAGLGMSPEEMTKIEKNKQSCSDTLGEWVPGNSTCNCKTVENEQRGYTLEQNGECVSGMIDGYPQEKISQLKNSCYQDKDFAEEKCDYLKDNRMTEVMTVANGLGIMLGQQTATNKAMACSQFANVAVLANAALAGFNTTCKFYKKSCEESCGQLRDFLTHSCNTHECRAAYGFTPDDVTMVTEAKKICKSKDRILEAAMANIGAIVATAENAKDCKKDSSLADGTNAPVNCADPAQAAKSAICLCQKNPRDPACLAAMKAGGGVDPYAGLNGGLGGAGSSGGFGSSNTQRDFTGTDQSKLGGGFGDMFSGGPGDYPVDPSQMGQNSAAGVNAAGGTGGRGIPGSGNPGQGGPGDDGAPGGSRFNSDIMSTAKGGRGGGSMGSSNSGGGERERAYGAQPGQPNGVNLKAFLPGNKYDPRRQIAGNSGPDGITGPHTNIWTKINNRYNAQRLSLMP